MRVIVTILFLLIQFAANAKTIIVGRNERITDPAKAIAMATGGDTVLIRNGVYQVSGLQITQSITLLGETNTILDGQNLYQVLVVSGKNITIKNIEVRNAGYSAMNDYAAIKIIDADHVTVENCRIRNAYFAIHVSNSVNCVIRQNNIIGYPKSEQLTGNGIHLWKCNHALIEGNYITGHRDGIYFEFVTESTIRQNLSEKNIRYGLHFMFSHSDHYIANTFRGNGAGVAVMYSKKVIMESNHFETNWGASAYGILLKEMTDGTIIHNTFFKNTVGIYMEGSSRMDVSNNIFQSNGWAVRVQASCESNSFVRNNFMGNSFDIATNGTMVLNQFHNNYWDKYEGYDLNKDGMGDVPFHPVSMYSMVVEQNPTVLVLMRSFIVSLMDKAEKAVPSLTPDKLVDDQPMIKPNKP